MNTANWLKHLKKLNPKLGVCMLENSNAHPGVYYINEKNEWITVCATDYNGGWVPEHSEWDVNGHLVHSGWRRVVKVLLALKLTSNEKVIKEFPSFYLHREPNPFAKVDLQDKVQKKTQEYLAENLEKTGASCLKADQALELAEEIHKKQTDHSKEELAKAKWLLEKHPEELLKEKRHTYFE